MLVIVVLVLALVNGPGVWPRNVSVVSWHGFVSIFIAVVGHLSGKRWGIFVVALLFVSDSFFYRGIIDRFLAGSIPCVWLSLFFQFVFVTGLSHSVGESKPVVVAVVVLLLCSCFYVKVAVVDSGRDGCGCSGRGIQVHQGALQMIEKK